MRISLNVTDFSTKNAFVRAAVDQARDVSSSAWEKANRRVSKKLSREINQLPKQELVRRLLRLMTLPARRRAVIDDAMRRHASAMRDRGCSVREIALELGVSVPSVYNITR